MRYLFKSLFCNQLIHPVAVSTGQHSHSKLSFQLIALETLCILFQSEFVYYKQICILHFSSITASNSLATIVGRNYTVSSIASCLLLHSTALSNLAMLATFSSRTELVCMCPRFKIGSQSGLLVYHTNKWVFLIQNDRNKSCSYAEPWYLDPLLK